jgi:hypothetical protein
MPRHYETTLPVSTDILLTMPTNQIRRQPSNPQNTRFNLNSPQSKLGLCKVSCVAWENAKQLFPKSVQIRSSTIAKHFSLTMPGGPLKLTCQRHSSVPNIRKWNDDRPTAKWRILMGQSLRCAASVGIFLAMTSAANATIGCAVTSSVVGAESANLYHGPDDASGIIREIPLGDIVQYPAQELAPVQVDDWIWVRHDITQEVIWNSGIYGWMRPENISDFCG